MSSHDQERNDIATTKKPKLTQFECLIDGCGKIYKFGSSRRKHQLAEHPGQVPAVEPKKQKTKNTNEPEQSQHGSLHPDNSQHESQQQLQNKSPHQGLLENPDQAQLSDNAPCSSQLPMTCQLSHQDHRHDQGQPQHQQEPQPRSYVRTQHSSQDDSSSVHHDSSSVRHVDIALETVPVNNIDFIIKNLEQQQQTIDKQQQTIHQQQQTIQDQLQTIYTLQHQLVNIRETSSLSGFQEHLDKSITNAFTYTHELEGINKELQEKNKLLENEISDTVKQLGAFKFPYSHTPLFASLFEKTKEMVENLKQTYSSMTKYCFSASLDISITYAIAVLFKVEVPADVENLKYKESTLVEFMRYSVERIRVNKRTKDNKQWKQKQVLQTSNAHEWDKTRKFVMDLVLQYAHIFAGEGKHFTRDDFYRKLNYTPSQYSFLFDNNLNTSTNSKLEHFLDRIIKLRNESTHNVEGNIEHVIFFDALITLGLLFSTTPITVSTSKTNLNPDFADNAWDQL